MTIVLNPEQEKLIQERVKSGLYNSSEAFVSAAIATLIQDEFQFAPGELDALCKVGTDELDRGEGLDGAQVFAELRRKSENIRARLNAVRP